MIELIVWSISLCYMINVIVSIFFWQTKLSRLINVTKEYCFHSLEKDVENKTFIIDIATRRREWFYQKLNTIIDDKYTYFNGLYYFFTRRNVFDYYFQGEFREDLLNYVKTVYGVDPTSNNF